MSSARTTTLQKVIPYSSPIPWILQWRWPSSEVLAVIGGRIACSCLLALGQGRPFLATTVIYVITCILFMWNFWVAEDSILLCRTTLQPYCIYGQYALIFLCLTTFWTMLYFWSVRTYIPRHKPYLCMSQLPPCLSSLAESCIISRFIFLTGAGVSKDLDSCILWGGYILQAGPRIKEKLHRSATNFH
jgi:hypothetical protein